MEAEKRDCENCKHHKETCRGGIFYHSCEAWDCTFEPTEEGKEAIEEETKDWVDKEMVKKYGFVIRENMERG
jgi:hypothetical protein